MIQSVTVSLCLQPDHLLLHIYQLARLLGVLCKQKRPLLVQIEDGCLEFGDGALAAPHLLLLLCLPLVDGHNDLVLKICQFLFQLLELAGQLLLLRLRQNDCALQLTVMLLQLDYPLVHFLVLQYQLVERNLIFVDYRCQPFILSP